MPFGVDAAGLVLAICCGKLTVAAMVPPGAQAAKSAKATSELRDAVMRAWPAVIALIGEVHPRDATMQQELLRLGVELFDARYASADMVDFHLQPVLKEMQLRFAKYRLNGGKELTWREAIAVASEDSMKLFALKSTLGATAAPEVLNKPPYVQPGKPPLQQAGAKQQQQRVAEVKELHGLSAVATK